MNIPNAVHSNTAGEDIFVVMEPKYLLPWSQKTYNCGP